MYGDAILVYDITNDRFFAGWAKQDKPFAVEEPKPLWSETVDGARKTRTLGNMQTIVRMLGDGVQIVSETKARQIEALKQYKARQGMGGL